MSLVAASSLGKWPRGLDDLAQLRINALNGIGGVDDLAYLGRKRKERDHAIPCTASGHAGHQKFLAPGSVGKFIDDAGLQRSPGEYGCQRFGHALEAVNIVRRASSNR